jgi:hypothetical protein
MNDFDKDWQRLVAAARQAPRDGDEAAPFGFSTRVAALAFERRPAGSMFGKYSLRAAWIACILAVVAVGANLSAILGAFSDDGGTLAQNDDPVSDVINLDS